MQFDAIDATILFLMWSLEEINNPLTKTWKQTKKWFFIDVYFVVFILVSSHHPVTYVRSTWVGGHFENKMPSVYSYNCFFLLGDIVYNQRYGSVEKVEFHIKE